jgi:uncharacterized membrane protein
MDPAGIEQVVTNMLQFIPVVVILGICGNVLMSMTHFGGGGETSSPEPPAEPKETPREEAERILMDRFARGEMTEEAYTSAMARL